jgi:hypothetical protein
MAQVRQWLAMALSERKQAFAYLCFNGLAIKGQVDLIWHNMPFRLRDTRRLSSKFYLRNAQQKAT